MIAKCVGEMNMYLLQDLGNFLIDLKMLTIPIPGKIRFFFFVCFTNLQSFEL